MLATPTRAAAFPFFYINPREARFTPIVQRFNTAKAPLEMFAPIGNSPVMISKESLKKVGTRADTRLRRRAFVAHHVPEPAVQLRRFCQALAPQAHLIST